MGIRLAGVISALLLVVAAPLQAVPFEVIGPAAVTVYTQAGIGTGVNAWLVMGDAGFDPVRPLNLNLPAVSTESGITGSSILIASAGPFPGLLPHEVNKSVEEYPAYDPFVGAGEPIGHYSTKQISLLNMFFWPFGFEGSADLTYVVAIGADAARYTTTFTFINAPPPNVSTAVVTAGQRVASETVSVPEPWSVWRCSAAMSVMAAARVRRRHRR